MTIRPTACALLLLLFAVPAPPAAARVTDYQWKLIQRSFDKLWRSKDFKKRQTALGKLGFADRAEAAQKLVGLFSGDVIGAATLRKERDDLLLTWDRGMLELDGFNHILERGNFLTDEQEDAYNRLSANLKRWNRRMYQLDRELTRADLLRTLALEQLGRISDPKARAWMLVGCKDAKIPVASRVLLVHSLWLARDVAAPPTLRELAAGADAPVAAIAMRALADLDTAFVEREKSVPVLIAGLDSAHWQVRAAAMAALARFKHVPAVGPLVARLQKEVGRLTEDASRALATITGFELGANPKGWQVWYEANKHRLEAVIRAREAKVAAEGETVGAIAFYGIRTTSRRIGFVIDISGSMSSKAGPIDPVIVGGDKRYPTKGTKMQIAKYELRKAIAPLATDARFNLIYFNEVARIRQETGMVTASDADKKKTIDWIRSNHMKANGGTNIFDALRRGLLLEVDTLYFLTDGTPRSGQIKDPGAILAEIGLRNQRLGLVIHVVGVGEEVNAEFLRALAARNGGRFVHTNK